LIARLTEEGHEVLYTREPGGTPTGEMIRDILQHDKSGEPICAETELFLFEASRAQLVRNVILPALEGGAHVVCDRFADSTTAYQGYGRGFSVDKLITINELAIGDAVPDVTLLLDVTVEQGFDRLASRQTELFQGLDRMEREEREFHERVRKGYLELARRWPKRFVVIDAARDPADIEKDVWGAVKRVLA
jgi:dTMP kinase